MEGEYLSLDTAKKIVEKDKEIERLKKREQECIDHYLVQCKYASEMEDKYITANYIINELEKYCNEEIKDYDKALNNKVFVLTEKGKESYEAEKMCFLDMLDKIKELKGSDKE